MLASIIYGIGMGAGYAVKGWFSKAKTENSEFDWMKFGSTLVVGGVVGGVGAYLGLTYEAASVSLETIGLLTVVDAGAIAFLHALKKKIWSLKSPQK